MSIIRCIKAVKEAVRIEDVAAEYTDLKPSGPYRLLGCCPFPHHDDSTPSFNVFTDDQRFKCFGVGCGLSGDVIDLEEVAGRHGETWTAVVGLSVRYGVELPVRSQRWHEGQERKAQCLDRAYRVLGGVLMRRIFKVIIMPWINSIEDEKERQLELERAWAEWGELRFWALRAQEISHDPRKAIDMALVYMENHPELAESVFE